jgi:hypothetical protein
MLLFSEEYGHTFYSYPVFRRKSGGFQDRGKPKRTNVPEKLSPHF